MELINELEVRRILREREEADVLPIGLHSFPYLVEEAPSV